MQFTASLNDQIEQVKAELKIEDQNFIGVFLYGSQNYELNYEGSDIDSIVLIANYDKPRQELTTPYGKTKIYTLKYFLYRLKKGDMECYEILYTKYKIINSIYEEIFMDFVKSFSSCMNYERVKRSLSIKLNEHLCHILWLMTNKEHARYNKKRLYWAIRVQNQLERIIAGESYADSLIYHSSEDINLIGIKTVVNYLSPQEFLKIYKFLIEYYGKLPRYTKDMSLQEEECFSTFYNRMNEWR